MSRYFIIAILLLGLIHNAIGKQFSKKVSPKLSFWYNYYYDAEALKMPRSKLTPSDSTADPANSSDSARRAETISHYSLQCGTAPRKIAGMDSLCRSKKPALDADDLKAHFGYDSSMIQYLENIPYLSVKLEYDGDRTDLKTLGVKIMGELGGRLYVRFPLSILPDIDTLTTVHYVLVPAIAQYQLEDLIKPGNIDIDEFIAMHKASYSIDTINNLPAIQTMIFTNGDYSQLDSIGIDTSPRLGNTVLVWLPINKIAQVNSLESVQKIIFPSKVHPNR